jgi:transposase-like protein
MFAVINGKFPRNIACDATRGEDIAYMVKITVGPVYCPNCPSIYCVDDMYPMTYDSEGNGWCTRCGYKYVAGTDWVLREEDLKRLEEIIEKNWERK